VLGVSPSGYHEHFRRRASPQRRKRLSNDALLVHIKAIHTEVKGEYGWPRVWKELLARGIQVGKERVRKLMALHGIKARTKRKFKATTAGTTRRPKACGGAEGGTLARKALPDAQSSHGRGDRRDELLQPSQAAFDRGLLQSDAVRAGLARKAAASRITGSAMGYEKQGQGQATFPRNNNLEWLRLIFATQVMLHHASLHMGLAIPEIVGHFPGVPAFFFVSGFLIYASYKNAPGRYYLENRLLRIYPCLVIVTLGGAAVTLIAHGWSDLSRNVGTYATWFFAQTTLGQAYNPELFRDVGIGVVNGSLWTLTAEVLFYICIPIIVWMEGRFRFAVLTLLCSSFVIYAIGPLVWTAAIYKSKTVYDFLELTPIVWGWMFAAGILAVKHFDHIQRWIKYFPWLVVPMTVMILLGDGILFSSSGNRLGLVYFGCYLGLVLWFAFVTPFVRLTFDLSYGVYVWHMPVINLLLVLAIPNASWAIAMTFVIATLSWSLVEKPALKLKHRSLKPVQI